MVKKILCLGMLVIIALSFSACGNADLNKQIDELQRKIEQQEDRMKEWEEAQAALQETIRLLNEEKILLQERMATFEEENRDLKERVAAIEQQLETIEIQRAAKLAYLNQIIKANYREANIADISFKHYFGIYDQSLVAIFYGGIYHGLFFDYICNLEIEGLNFDHPSGYPIHVYKENKIYMLAEAYHKGFVTKAELQTIHTLYRNRNK